jgi:hypothetical protein
MVYLISRYRLEKDRQQQEFQYRQEMALRMGVIITGHHPVVHVKSGDPDRGGGEKKLLTHDGPPGQERT